MTYHNNQGSFCNGYYLPNMDAHRNSFIVNPQAEAFKPANYHGTPMMPFKPLKFEPFKKEPIIINQFKMY